MKYFVELTTYYDDYHTVKLYPIVNGHLAAEDGLCYRFHPDMEDPTGYMVNL